MPGGKAGTMSQTRRPLAVAAVVAAAAMLVAATARAAHAASARRTLHLTTASCSVPNPNLSTIRWQKGDDSPKEANHLAIVATLTPGACAGAYTDESVFHLGLPLAEIGRLAFDFKETNPDAHDTSLRSSAIRLGMLIPGETDPSQRHLVTLVLVGAACNHPMAGHPGWGQAHFTTDKVGCTIVAAHGGDDNRPFSADGTESAWQKVIRAYPGGVVDTAGFFTGENRSTTTQTSRYDRLSFGTGVLWSDGAWGSLIDTL
jgi:hypothetical protein